MDTQVVLMLTAGTLLLLNGLIARGVNPDVGSDLGSETMPPPEPRETQPKI
jgi:hypothetical protein